MKNADIAAVASQIKARKPETRFRLFTLGELSLLPPPEWLIEGVLEVGGQAMFYGPSGQGKSFVALDWALSVATGKAWQGHRVKQGPVVFIAGEGARSIEVRARAWKILNRIEQVPDFYVVREAVQMMASGDVRQLESQFDLLNVRPTLIIIDTFARAFVGGEENAAKDTGQFMDALRQLQERQNAAVMILHHTGKKGLDERGSSAMRGALDTMIVLEPEGDLVISLTNTKQKEAPEFKPIRLRLEPVNIPGGTGLTDQCLVPRLFTAAEVMDLAQRALLGDGPRRALVALATFPDMTATPGDWRGSVTTADGGEVPDKTFDNWRKKLQENGLISPTGTTHPHRYTLTDPGRSAIDLPVGILTCQPCHPPL